MDEDYEQNSEDQERLSRFEKNNKIAKALLDYFLEQGYSIDQIKGIAALFQTKTIDYAAMHKNGK